MSDRDDNRGYRGDERREWRRAPMGDGGQQEPQAQRGRYNSDEARYGQAPRGGSGEGEREPWRRDRYGSRFDQDRVDYGSGYDPQQGGYGAGYAGQEYGIESGGRDRQEPRRRQDHSRETWRPGAEGAPYGALELNARNSGVQDFGAPHDYAYHPRQGHEFDPEYVSWRDQQLAGHDRDYAEWRRHQHEQYDNEYRSFRDQKRDHFGKTFSEWRSQRDAKGGDGSPVGQPEAGERTADSDRKH